MPYRATSQSKASSPTGSSPSALANMCYATNTIARPPKTAASASPSWLMAEGKSLPDWQNFVMMARCPIHFLSVRTNHTAIRPALRRLRCFMARASRCGSGFRLFSSFTCTGTAYPRPISSAFLALDRTARVALDAQDQARHAPQNPNELKNCAQTDEALIGSKGNQKEIVVIVAKEGGRVRMIHAPGNHAEALKVVMDSEIDKKPRSKPTVTRAITRLPWERVSMMPRFRQRLKNAKITTSS